MSRKNRRRTMNRPLSHTLLPSTIASIPQTAAAVPTPTMHTPPAAEQSTPFFEQNPKGGLRVALTPECWCDLENIPSHKLQSDPTYQRAISDAHVAEILNDWDARVMNFPKVSVRDGAYYIFDGAHTKTVTDRKNDGREHLVPCIVYHNLKLEDEAYLFAMQNGCSKEVAFGYKLNARIKAGDELAIGFQACNEKLGLKIIKEGRSNQNVISAVNTAYRLYETWHEQRYMDVMSLILETWSGEPYSLSQVVIEGVSRFFRAYASVFDRNRFIRDLSVISVKRLAEKSRGAMHDTAQAMVNSITRIYNRKGGKNCVKSEWLMALESMPKDKELKFTTEPSA